MSFSGMPPPPPRYPNGEPDQLMKDLQGMHKLAKTDEAMAEMLEQARVYYLLKKPEEPVKLDEINWSALAGLASRPMPPPAITKKEKSTPWWKLV